MSHEITYYVTKSKKQFAKCAKIIREHKLYSGNYSGFYWFAFHGRWAEDVVAISVAYENETPIGISIKLSERAMHGCEITCYVKPEYRHKGIGSTLVKKIATKKTINAGAHQFPIGFPKYDRYTS